MPIEAIPVVKIYAGLDLGQVNDRSALAILVRTSLMGLRPDAFTARREETRSYDLRFIERWKLGTSYPDVVRRCSQVVENLSLKFPNTAIELAYDATGVGRAVGELLRVARWPTGFRLTPISIHGGDRSREESGRVYVPKRDLIAALVVLFQTGGLRIAAGLAEQDVLLNELLNFRGRMSASGHDTYSNASGGANGAVNDDLVSAVAFAAYRASLRLNGPQYGAIV